MKIQDQELYHGAALAQIVRYGSFKALNRGSGEYGHYLINTDRHIFVKYSTSDASPWQYTMSVDEIDALVKVYKRNAHVFLCLVCGPVTICALSKPEISAVLDVTSADQQWIRVEVPEGGGCHVVGSNGRLNHVVPHNSFPGKAFA